LKNCIAYFQIFRKIGGDKIAARPVFYQSLRYNGAYLNIKKLNQNELFKAIRGW
jgi:hypothetical protein